MYFCINLPGIARAMVGKVIQSTGAWYQVKSAYQPIYTCTLRGKLRLNNWKLTNPVAVGDEVVFTLEKEKTTGVITEVLPRKNYIIRQSPRRKNYSQIIAANIDQILLVATLVAPRTTLGLVDRFLVAAESWSIPAILLFNKVDLLDVMQQDELKAIRKLYEAIGYSENTKLATYSAEVCMQLIRDYYCIVLITLYVSVCGSSLEL